MGSMEKLLSIIWHVQLIDYYYMLNIAIRTSNLQLCQYDLPKLTNIFFIFNLKQNDSRNLVKYQNNFDK